jgi:hypothetical protein
MTIKISANFRLPKDQRPDDYVGMTQEYYNFEGETKNIIDGIVRTTLAFWAGTHDVSLEDMSEAVDEAIQNLQNIQTGLVKQIAG